VSGEGVIAIIVAAVAIIPGTLGWLESKRNKQKQENADAISAIAKGYGEMLDRNTAATDRIIRNLEREMDRMQEEIDALRSQRVEDRASYEEAMRRMQDNLNAQRSTIISLRGVLESAGLKAPEPDSGTPGI